MSEEIVPEDVVEQIEYESPTPALDKVMAGEYDDQVSKLLEPEDYFSAALEAYNLLGQTLSETGSMYLLLGSMLGAITPSADTEVTE